MRPQPADLSSRGSGLGFVEGPVIRADGSLVVVSLSLGTVTEVHDGGNAVTLAELNGSPNGAAEGRDGSLFIAQNGGHCPGHQRRTMPGGIQVVRPDGAVEWLTQDPVAPNDICFGSDGFLYVTDPTRQDDLDDGRIWRVHPGTGDAEILAQVDWFPNGIGFGPESDAVFVSSTRDGRIWRFPLGTRGLESGEQLEQVPIGYPDGLAFDDEGTLIVAVVGGAGESGFLQTWESTGALGDRLDVGQSRYITNLAISDERTIYITDSSAGVLRALKWRAAGLALHPFRT